MRASRPARRCLHYLSRAGTPPARPFSLSSPARTTASDPDPRSASSTSSAPAVPPSPPPPPRHAAGPKPVIDVKHIRTNIELHEQNCRDRNYPACAAYPRRIAALHDERQRHTLAARRLRERANLLGRRLADPSSPSPVPADPASLPPDDASLLPPPSRDELLAEARRVKTALSAIEADESRAAAEMDALAAAMPNLTSPDTPRGSEPRLLAYINDPPPAPAPGAPPAPSHVAVGTELRLLDFASAATTSGWGWYFLLGDAARLEHALVSHALAAAARAGWAPVSPPSVVYGHVAAACGFQPRDQHGETQIYTLGPSPPSASAAEKGGDAPPPGRCLAGTAEIPLAGLRAGATLAAAALPQRRAAASRCFRAEAGARGADARGLYRVHEFTKVELFAWTAPDAASAAAVLDDVVDLQTDILQSLGLPCRVLEMPTADLGASAMRKIDIEAYFPGRAAAAGGKNGGGGGGGWGEVTSASVCGDYQTRRLGTRLRGAGGSGLGFPWTVNGTALAVPRVLAALLENGWDEADRSVAIPEVLRPWMDGKEKIGLQEE